MTTNDQPDTAALLSELRAEIVPCTRCFGKGKIEFKADCAGFPGAVDVCVPCNGTGFVPLFPALRKDCKCPARLVNGLKHHYACGTCLRRKEHSGDCTDCQGTKWVPADVDVGELIEMTRKVGITLQVNTYSDQSDSPPYMVTCYRPMDDPAYGDGNSLKGVAVKSIHAAVMARKEAK